MKKKDVLDEEQLYQLLRDADDLWYKEQLPLTESILSSLLSLFQRIIMGGILLASSSILLGKEEKDEQE